MNEYEHSSAVIDRELAAIDDALAGGEASHEDPRTRELQDLALALRADAPEPTTEFRRELRTRLDAGFPPARASARGRASAALAGGRGAMGRLPSPAALRTGLPPARRLLPAMGAVAAVVLVLVVVLSTDMRSGSTDDSGGGSGGGAVSSLPADAGSSAPDAAEGRSAQDRSAEPLPAPPGGFVPGQGERRIERSIALELEAPVDEIARVADQVTALTNRHGGFVLNSSVATGDDSSGGEFELRIPANRLRAALRDLSALATVRSQSQNGRDVTRDFVTARDRLQAARAERRSLLRRLEKADTDQEVEAIRARLDLVAGEINGLRGQLRDLHLRTDYAVVTVSLAADEDGSSGGAGGSFDDAIGDAGDLLVGFAGVAIRVLALALPLGLIALLLWLAGAGLRRRRRESALA